MDGKKRTINKSSIKERKPNNNCINIEIKTNIDQLKKIIIELEDVINRINEFKVNVDVNIK